MSNYLGVVIEQSLADPSFVSTVDVVRRKRDPNGTWVFLLVRVPEEAGRATFARLQSALAKSQNWYAHFFRDEELVVIYSDAVFSMKTDPATWADARAHGLEMGIPEGQLDFWPCTLAQMIERFGADVAV